MIRGCVRSQARLPFFRRSFSTTLREWTKHPEKGDRVYVAMSGGVDSSVAARLLVEKDYDLSAVFMRNWDARDESGTDKGCQWEKDWEDVQRVCKLLGIPCQMIDLSKEYWTRVFEPSLAVWETGNTPNPDVWCNKEVKFGALIDRLVPDQSEKAWLATGHYARKDWWPSDSEVLRPRLLRAQDMQKDQTYYLSSIGESSLARALFPLGDFSKPRVRELAQEYCLPTAARPESMGLCFVGEKKKFNDFLSQYITPKPGPIVNLRTRKRLGTHEGLWTYTIGQGAKISGMTSKMYVAGKDKKENCVYVVADPEHPSLYCSVIKLKDWRWIWGDSSPSEIDTHNGLAVSTQFRHRMLDTPSALRRSGDGTISIKFKDSQKAVSPGQVAAVYKDGWCLGSGVISDTNSTIA